MNMFYAFLSNFIDLFILDVLSVRSGFLIATIQHLHYSMRQQSPRAGQADEFV
jgi:hypothetical protein